MFLGHVSDRFSDFLFVFPTVFRINFLFVFQTVFRIDLKTFRGQSRSEDMPP